MKRSPMPKSSKPMKRGTKPLARKRMKPGGKKTDEWATVRAELKVRFEAAGITQCEAGFFGCWIDNALSFAHAAKRRKLSPNDLYTVALLCVPCHESIEYLQPETMKGIILHLINAREVQP